MKAYALLVAILLSGCGLSRSTLQQAQERCAPISWASYTDCLKTMATNPPAMTSGNGSINTILSAIVLGDQLIANRQMTEQEATARLAVDVQQLASADAMRQTQRHANFQASMTGLTVAGAALQQAGQPVRAAPVTCIRTGNVTNCY